MRELITAEDINIQTKILGKRISDNHRDDKTPVVMVGLLNGCYAFYSDVVRAMPIVVECDFMRVKSYAKRKQGDIQITKDLETPIKGKHVYIVDDIYDSGKTMDTLIKHLQEKNPASITPLVLFKKKGSNRDDLMWGFELEDEYWIHGYGLDDERGLSRNLPHVFGYRMEVD